MKRTKKPLPECSGCRWWGEIPTNQPGYRYGTCRRFPPTFPDKRQGIELRPDWQPITLNCDVCGEWKKQ